MSSTDAEVRPTVVTVTVAETKPQDVGRGIVRIDPETMRALGAGTGDTVEIVGTRRAIGRLYPNFPDDRGRKVARMDNATRSNAGVTIGREVQIVPIVCRPALTLVVRSTAARKLTAGDAEDIARRIDGVSIRAGDRLDVVLYGGRHEELGVVRTDPAGPVIIQPATLLEIEKTAPAPQAAAAAAAANAGDKASYEDVGGLDHEMQKLREIVELPLTRPELFTRLGITPPRGVLLYGPPGTGKTLLARAIANETEAKFFYINGPEIIRKFYGESEARLREIFEQARKSRPSIIFIDEIDAIAPKRDQVVGDVEKRVVAQLLTLMDGLKDRGDIVVIGATNLPNALDPALRRPGRFDREIALGIPNVAARREILNIHTRGMPLREDVDLDKVAETTHGFTGADLQALCREAAMAVLRRHMPNLSSDTLVPAELVVTMQDFEDVVGEITPTVLRELVVEIPTTKWSDAGGLDDAKRALVETVLWPIKHRTLFDRYNVAPPRGVVLHGPPGTGKTLLARALASEAQINFISIRGPELLSKYVGESERGIREIFERARQAAPAIIFLDELDALVPLRGRAHGSDVTDRVVAQFLTEIDGLRSLRDVWLLGATNRLDMIDPALLRPGRFEIKLAIGLPGHASRKSILQVHTKSKPLAADVNLDEVATQAEGLSGADLAMLCSRATLAVVRRHVAAGADDAVLVPIAMADFREAMAQIAAERAAAGQPFAPPVFA